MGSPCDRSVNDLAQRLRESAKAARAIDRAALLEEAAAQIERLRLTDAEREALWFAIAYAQNAGHECEATLRGLLERTK